MNSVKKTLMALIIVIILMTSILFFLYRTVSPDILNAHLDTYIRQVSPLRSHVDGTVTWQLLPQPALRVTQVRFDSETTGYHNAITINSMIYKLKWEALWRGKLVFNELNIDGMIWCTKPTSTNTVAHGEKKITSKTKPSRGNRLHLAAEFDIQTLSITNGRALIESPVSRLKLSAIQVKLNQPNAQNIPFQAQFKTKINYSDSNQTLKGNMLYSGNVQLPSDVFLHALVNTSHLKLKGQLTIKNAQVNNISINKIYAQIQVDNNLMTFDPFNLSLYEGESIGQLYYHLQSHQLKINQTATNLNAQQLSKAKGLPYPFTGQLQLSIRATTIPNPSQWLAPVESQGNITLNNGTLTLFDLDKIEKQIQIIMQSHLANAPKEPKASSILNESIPLTDYSGQTEFKLFTLQYEYLQNNLLNYTLVLQTHSLTLESKGSINPLSRAIHSTCWMRLITRDTDINAMQTLMGPKGVAFLLSGTLEQPRVSVTAATLKTPQHD